MDFETNSNPRCWCLHMDCTESLDDFDSQEDLIIHQEERHGDILELPSKYLATKKTSPIIPTSPIKPTDFMMSVGTTELYDDGCMALPKLNVQFFGKERVDAAINLICYIDYDNVFSSLPSSPKWHIHGYKNIDGQVDEEYTIDKRESFNYNINELMEKRKTLSGTFLTELEFNVNKKRAVLDYSNYLK
jgi:hypothetical protein